VLHGCDLVISDFPRVHAGVGSVKAATDAGDVTKMMIANILYNLLQNKIIVEQIISIEQVHRCALLQLWIASIDRWPMNDIKKCECRLELCTGSKVYNFVTDNQHVSSQEIRSSSFCV
jgi:hypothetical protein